MVEQNVESLQLHIGGWVSSDKPLWSIGGTPQFWSPLSEESSLDMSMFTYYLIELPYKE